MEATLERLIDEPELFVKEILKVEPDEWQCEALRAMAGSPRLAIRSGHGVGKTAFEAWSALWFLFTRPRSKVVMTAPTIRQLYDILMSEICKWLRGSVLNELFEWQKTRVVSRLDGARWFAVARTAARPENMQGFHDDHLLFIMDEASGIGDAIYEAVEGALTGTDNKLIMCGNPTKNSGFFKRAFFEDREIYHVMKVSGLESGRVSDEYCERLMKQYGKESDVVRVRVLGEFPKAESDGLIALEWVEAAMMREGRSDGELVFGVDVARFGDDETVICPRMGEKVLPNIILRKTDLMTTAGRIVIEVEKRMKEKGKKCAYVNVDDDGVGGGVTDRLKEVFHEKNLHVTVTACHNGGKARDKHYANWGAESYFTLRDRLQEGRIILPRDEELAAQLSTRKYAIQSDGRLILERKSEYKKRVGRSPDRADALVLAFAPSLKVTLPREWLYQESYWLK